MIEILDVTCPWTNNSSRYIINRDNVKYMMLKMHIVFGCCKHH